MEVKIINELQECLINEDHELFKIVLDSAVKEQNKLDLFYLYLKIYQDTYYYDQQKSREYLNDIIFKKLDPISQVILNKYYLNL